jgi:hypothetical protein
MAIYEINTMEFWWADIFESNHLEKDKDVEG